MFKYIEAFRYIEVSVDCPHRSAIRLVKSNWSRVKITPCRKTRKMPASTRNFCACLRIVFTGIPFKLSMKLPEKERQESLFLFRRVFAVFSVIPYYFLDRFTMPPEVAINLLAIPCSSAACDRVFSIAGLASSGRCNSL